MTQPERWKAPAEDGAILFDPPSERIEEILETNRRRLNSARLTLLGKPLGEVRSAAAARIVREIRHNSSQPRVVEDRAPFIVTGHQPELFHPGVWVKNFGINGLARRHGLNPLNLIVDGDTVKSTSLHIPQVSSDAARIHRHAVPFDSWDGEEPYAFRTIRDSNLFRTFPERARPLLSEWGFAPMLGEFWDVLVESRSRLAMTGNMSNTDVRLGDLFSSARRDIESRWGCRNFELPLSKICFIPEMVGHLLTDLPQFQAYYNGCLREYRRRHGLRSNRHPAPDLEADGDRFEAPFWWFDQTARRRQRLFVQMKGDRVSLFPGLNAEPIVVRRGEPDLSDVLQQSGVILMTRALMTTLFMRLSVADLFIHGIGGAKYDEVTDNIIRQYFHMEPPEYLVVTGTLRLPLKGFSATPSDRLRLIRRLRDLRWGPERFASKTDPATREMIDEKVRWLEKQPTTRTGRRMRYRELLRSTEALRSRVAREIAEATASLDRCEQELSANELLSRRDYAFPLYPENLLRPFCEQLL